MEGGKKQPGERGILIFWLSLKRLFDNRRGLAKIGKATTDLVEANSDENTLQSP
jgi:hypothetical protein